MCQSELESIQLGELVTKHNDCRTIVDRNASCDAGVYMHKAFNNSTKTQKLYSGKKSERDALLRVYCNWSISCNAIHPAALDRCTPFVQHRCRPATTNYIKLKIERGMDPILKPFPRNSWSVFLSHNPAHCSVESCHHHIAEQRIAFNALNV